MLRLGLRLARRQSLGTGSRLSLQFGLVLRGQLRLARRLGLGLGLGLGLSLALDLSGQLGLMLGLQLSLAGGQASGVRPWIRREGRYWRPVDRPRRHPWRT